MLRSTQSTTSVGISKKSSIASVFIRNKIWMGSAFTSWRTHINAFLFLIGLWCFAPGQSVPLCAGIEEIDKLKTAFIYQFTNYVEWPEQTSSNLSKQNSFIITVVGDSPIIQELENLSKVKTVKGRSIVVYKGIERSKLRKSHIIVIASSDEGLLRQVLEETRNLGSLIISDTEGFAEKGAAINFFVEEGRLRFEVNRTVLKEQGLQASSQLLKLAKLVE